MAMRKECLAYEYGKWRFEWYVNEGGDSPAARTTTRRSSVLDAKDELTALFEFLADCSGQLRDKQRIRSEAGQAILF